MLTVKSAPRMPVMTVHAGGRFAPHIKDLEAIYTTGRATERMGVVLYTEATRVPTRGE